MSQPELRMLRLDALRLSQTTTQAERRRHFDRTAIAELADSIKSVGLLQPVLARPIHGSTMDFEIVAGERRFLAAQQAGLDEIQVSVRELSDEQVLEVQLVENLQREGLHELAEAEGYDQLRRQYGYSIEDLIAKIGKSRSYVFGRLKLLDLAKKARAAFYDGEISASVALLLARIPVEKIQDQALEDLLQGDHGDGPVSYRAAAAQIQSRYMMALDAAPFPTGRADLIPDVPACGACPKNTAQQRELFGDVKPGRGGAGFCTDPVCFAAKREAHAADRLKNARAAGQTIIEGKAAKEAAMYGAHSLQGGLVALDAKCHEDAKGRTYRQLLGRDFKPTLLVLPEKTLYGRIEPESEKVIEVARREDLGPLLREKGVAPTRSARAPAEIARERKARAEREYRARLFEEVRAKLPRVLSRQELNAIALEFFRRLDHETRKRLCGVWEWVPEKIRHSAAVDLDAPALAAIPKLSDDSLALFLQDCVYIGELGVGNYDDSKPVRLLELSKRLRVDPERIRRELSAEAKPVKPKGKAKGKAKSKARAGK